MSLLYINFDTTNFQGSNALSSYALPQCPFTFTPLLTSSQTLVSTKKVLWDFGDQSTSTEINPTHYYKWPGIYTVSLIVYDVEGKTHKSSYSPSVSVIDLLPNQLVADTIDSLSFDVPAGQILPFLITRSNSWQTYANLSGSNYTINLYVSGSLDPLVDVERYNGFSWSHLVQQSYFYNKVTTSNTNAVDVSSTFIYPGGRSETIVEDMNLIFEYIPISAIETTTDKVHAVFDQNNNINICLPNIDNSFFVGTTGTALAYFTSNAPKHYNSVPPPLIIFCSLDTSKIEDSFTKRIDYFKYNSQSIGYLNTSPAVLYAYSRYNPAMSFSFSTNGIDDQGDAFSTAFEIPAISWQNSNIPFVVKLKDEFGFTTLFYPLLSSDAANQSVTSSVYNASLSLLSAGQHTYPGGRVVDVDYTVDATFYAEFLKSLSTDVGGYFKGYFISPHTNFAAKLSASVTVTDPLYYRLNTVNTIYPTTSGSIIFTNSDIIQSQGNISSRVFELVPRVYTPYHGSTFAVAPSCNYGFKRNASWALSADGNHLFIEDYNGKMINTFNLLNIAGSGKLNINASSVAIDGYNNAWITILSGSGSPVIKLDPSGNLITYAINGDLPINNNYNTDPETLYAVSSLPIVAPYYVETDKDSNIWVSNINPAYNYLIKYDRDGNYVTSISFGDIALPDKIVVDGDNNAWVVVLDGTGMNTYGPLITLQSDASGNFPLMSLSNNEFYALTSVAVNDAIAKLDSDGNILYSWSGFVRPTSMAYDLSGNMWVAHYNNTLTMINADNKLTTDYYVGSAYNDITLQALFNLTCDTYNKLSIYNKADNSIYIIDAANPSLSAQCPQGNSLLAVLTANDDINGYRWITKYARVPASTRNLNGVSNVFALYPDSGVYNIAKQNEDFNMQGYFNTLQIPEYLVGKNVLFKDFLGSIFGAASAEPYELGKTIYERTANFVDNIDSIDTATVDALISLSEQTGTSLGNAVYNYPAQLRRVIDILSIKHSKLYGNINQYNLNFSDLNGSNPSNRGAKLDLANDTFAIGETLVAYEKFSHTYKTVRLPAPPPGWDIDLVVTSFAYYTSAWNLPVTLDPSITGTDIGLYYDFYRYINTTSDARVDSIINWNDPTVTLNPTASSYTGWSSQDGIMDNILNYELTKGLRLFTSAVDIVYNS